MNTYTKIGFAIFSIFVSSALAFAQEFFTPPAEVTNVSATGGDGVIQLAWDEGVDEDGLITGYKIYYGPTSVQTPDDMYEHEMTVETNSATLTDLENGTRYYIAITALDDEENESLTYSRETSATPSAPNPPTLESVEYLTQTEIIVNMSVPTTAENPMTAFVVQAEGSQDSIAITQAEFIGTSVILNFEEESLLPGTSYSVTATASIQNATGESVVAGSGDQASFFTPEPEMPEEESEIDFLEDFIPEEESFEEEEVTREEETVVTSSQPPLDVQNLAVNDTRLESDNIVLLSWDASLDLDLADQIIYTKKEGFAWDSGYSIGPDTTEIELDVEANENYEVKVITVNNAGLESDGATLAFSTHLTETGPATMWGLIAMMFMIVSIASLSRRSTL